jgi:hypothetical protein
VAPGYEGNTNAGRVTTPGAPSGLRVQMGQRTPGGLEADGDAAYTAAADAMGDAEEIDLASIGTVTTDMGGNENAGSRDATAEAYASAADAMDAESGAVDPEAATAVAEDAPEGATGESLIIPPDAEIPEPAPSGDGGGGGGNDGYAPSPEDPWAGWFNEDGVLTSIGLKMTTEQMNEFLNGTGIGNYPRSETAFRDLMQALSTYAKLPSTDGTAAQNLRNQIKGLVHDFNNSGWVNKGGGKKLDRVTLLESARGGGGDWGAGGDGGGGDGGGGDGEGESDPPIELVDPPNYDYERVPEWIRKLIGEHPDAAKLWETMLSWDAMQLGRDDRELAVNEFQKAHEGIFDSERRRLLDEFISAGPQETYSADDIAKMKAANAEGFGNDVEMMDADLREYAAALGVDPSSLAGIGVAERARAGRALTSADRGIDLEAARVRAADDDRWFSQALAGEGALTGVEAQYAQQLAALLAGVPGLIQTGNPLAGLADYQIYDSMLSQGPGSMEKVGAYANAAGSAATVAAALSSMGI